MSKPKIAASVGVSATATRGMHARARRVGLAWPLPEELRDDALDRRSRWRSRITGGNRLAAVHRELHRPGVTPQLLWEEHRAVHPDGCGYSHFCEL